jgi:hypothetical protein
MGNIAVAWSDLSHMDHYREALQAVRRMGLGGESRAGAAAAEPAGTHSGPIFPR